MIKVEKQLNPAEEASRKTLNEVYSCLEHKESFIVEAGAGAGKTYTLVKAIHYLIERNRYFLPQRNQKIACITFTNVAKDEIDARTDRDPLIYCNTIHAFCWSLISGFQKQLRDQLPKLHKWSEEIADVGDLGDRKIEYDLGHRYINEHNVSIHHDEVLQLFIAFMEIVKFRRIMTDKFPIILIDEYQDTNAKWVESIKSNFLGQKNSPQFGFFGDHWQKIYGDGCGSIEHPSLKTVITQANFRSVSTVVDCLNRMRPKLPQSVVDPNKQGCVRIFHTNDWKGSRQKGGHWDGDLPIDEASSALQNVLDLLTEEGWDLSPDSTKILMLTHRALAGKQGYPSIPEVFRYNSSFTNKEHPHIAYFSEVLEPACNAYLSKKYGEMFNSLGSNKPAIHTQTDKKSWAKAMDRLIELRTSGSVGNVIDHLRSVRRPSPPASVENLEHKLQTFDPEAGDDIPRGLKELTTLRAVPYQEVIALCKYLSGHSPFETKHGVKGAEFENVVIVVGRGWNFYNFNNMLEIATRPDHIPADKQKTFERNRNLFYVTCSRPKRRLAILFTQQLSKMAMQTVSNWFGSDSVEALGL